MTIYIILGLIALAQILVILFMKGATSQAERDSEDMREMFYDLRQEVRSEERYAAQNHRSIVNLYRNIIPAITGGVIWKTLEGHEIPLRMMSDNHIENCLEGNFGGTDPDLIRERMMDELERRALDDHYSEKNNQISPRQQLKLHDRIITKMINPSPSTEA